MGKLIVSLILAILLLIFSTQNLHPVWVRFIVGPALQLPVIVALAGAFIGGYALATFSQILKGAKKNNKDIDLED
ncbi:MAG TPA: hypothetical protein ENI77_08125 [Nitrospirae bacterium]|nr:hypothetical protein [Nitrospirota bacterium]